MQARDRIAALRRAQGQIADLVVSVTSPDGLARVEVGGRGDLRGLWLDDAAFECLPARLAELIVQLAREAEAEAKRQAQQILDPLLPADGPGAGPLGPGLAITF
jgi:DNA-binding protein YbaB